MSTVLGEEKMRYICGSKYNTAIKRNGQKPFISIGIHLENIKLSKKNAAYSKISIKGMVRSKIPTSILHISKEGDR